MEMRYRLLPFRIRSLYRLCIELLSFEELMCGPPIYVPVLLLKSQGGSHDEEANRTHSNNLSCFYGSDCGCGGCSGAAGRDGATAGAGDSAGDVEAGKGWRFA